MPRKRKPARIYWRKPRPGREGAWVILDAGREIRTGAGSEQEATAALGEYLLTQNAPPDGPQRREGLTIDQALAFYADEHAATVSDPDRISYAIDALAGFWGSLPVSAVTGATCRRYARERGVGDGTVRRELGVLRAALRHCEREGYLVSAPPVTLPPMPAPKTRWLTRDEVARMIRAARASRKTAHIARFILLGVYTGTRPGAILRLQWHPNTGGGHVDLDHGVLYRAPAAAVQSKKRQTPLRLPRQMVGHLRRWRSDGHLIETKGGPVLSVKRAWASVCKAAKIEGASPHSLRHTCATWLMQRGADRWDAAGFLGMTVETLERVYGHHHPDHQGSALRAIERR